MNDVLQPSGPEKTELGGQQAAPAPFKCRSIDVCSFCPECGPNVGVDEDGCCASCGHDAMPAAETVKAFWQAQAAPAPGWQPIETAPKDKWFLGWEYRYQTPIMCKWGVSGFMPVTAVVEMRLQNHSHYFPPTHWMPLPAPPGREER